MIGLLVNFLNMQNKQKVIHFEIDPAEINKNVIADVAVLGDSKETLSKILPLIKKNEHSKWRDKFTQLSKN